MTTQDRTLGGNGTLAHPMAQRIEFWPLDKLIPLARNPRTHSDAQVAQIAASIAEFGFNSPILVDSKAGILAGHGRLLASRKLGLTEVPVIVLDHLSEKQKRAYIIADNALALSAGWDDDLLRAELLALQDENFDIGLIGLEDRELARLLSDPEADDQANVVPEPPENPVTVPGDLWLCGKHRVLAGDATNADVVARLLGERKPRLLVTDPPYGISLDSEWRDRAGLNKHGPAEASYMKHRTEGHTETTISGDTRADWSEAFELVPSLEVAYVWHATSHMLDVAQGLRRIGFDLRQQIIWLKTVAALSRSAYHWKHEPCWYAVRKGSTAHFVGSRDQTTVWEAASPKQIMGGSDEEKFDHPTQKPVDLMRRPILNHTKRGELVYEPFLGSGTTLAAAELTERVCCGIELDPKYVDVVILRWQSMTNKKATLERDGRTFDEIAVDRREAANPEPVRSRAEC